MRQTPDPGSRHVAACGDVFEIRLHVPAPAKGSAWLRTNYDRADTRRREIIRHVTHGKPILSRDWHDLPMRQVSDGRFAVRLPLVEPGRFEAKAFFLPEAAQTPQWPSGQNVVVKVEPAFASCCNTIYTAFVRQFGPQKQAPFRQADSAAAQALTASGYTVIPLSGTFRNLIKELDFIVKTLRFRIIQLLPVFPTPTTYGRMGTFGSPFAPLDFMAVDPALAEFDRSTTPMGQFLELVDAVHRREASIFLDIPINHTGWASVPQTHHPEWFARGKDRNFESPGAWGVTWEDLAKLDYRHQALWTYMANVFLFWCRKGVDGFRCDAGYMIPARAWEYIVAKVRLQYPDSIFLLEGLGGDPRDIPTLLGESNLDWAYSELFQNVDRTQIEAYLPGALQMSTTHGALVHFAETHDNNRLASVSRPYACLRTAVSALFSHAGAFGITNGVEWFAREKIDVHEAGGLNWGAAENMVEVLRRLNTLLCTHPAFEPDASVRLVHASTSNTVALLRCAPREGPPLLVAANLDTDQRSTVLWRTDDVPDSWQHAFDLLSGRTVTMVRDGGRTGCELAPAEVLCLTEGRGELHALEADLQKEGGVLAPCVMQRLRAKVLEIRRMFGNQQTPEAGELDGLARQMRREPRAVCASCATHRTGADPLPAPVVTWEWPRDRHRTVMVPPGCLLEVRAPRHFRADLLCRERTLCCESSLPLDNGGHFALLVPAEQPQASCHTRLVLRVFEDEGCAHDEASLLYLPAVSGAAVWRTFARSDVQEREVYALCTNGLGGMAQVRGLWSEIRSQYDALLAGNLDSRFPVDRHVMLTRCRTWIVCRGYSHDLDRDCLESCSQDDDGTVNWHFTVPACEGLLVSLEVELRMADGRNAVSIAFTRRRAGGGAFLEDEIPVNVVVRPDVEDRSVHEKTRASSSLKARWLQGVQASAHGFSFTPVRERRLMVDLPSARFVLEPEWLHDVEHPEEIVRGLDGRADLFSPGHFTVPLKAGETAILHAAMGPDPAEPPYGRARNTGPTAAASPAGTDLARAMRKAMARFVVRRRDHKTVIAGYPWFLDWGRDTLIALRGLIAAGMTAEARDILCEFGRLEEGGTLPNMLRGGEAANRDTSDAALWFCVACNDLLASEAGTNVLEQDLDGRTVMDVLRSIVTSYSEGTSNGIVMDPGSGLIFSPSHFTWMDTNHPAGTPREGYPVEIQALWFATLRLMSRLDPGSGWDELAGRVRDSLHLLYPRGSGRTEQGGCAFLADCLHAKPGVPARDALADDALRPNQLLAVTLGAVGDRPTCASILSSCETLLVPGAIRSLADRPVSVPLPVEMDGRLLNDPLHPYQGTYEGDENTRRKPAYHNGTAWTWLFPSYSEALYRTFGPGIRERALAVLQSSVEIVNRGCLGQVPELVDGDAPHKLRGCGAQAWGVTELYRVFKLLEQADPCTDSGSEPAPS